MRKDADSQFRKSQNLNKYEAKIVCLNVWNKGETKRCSGLNFQLYFVAKRQNCFAKLFRFIMTPPASKNENYFDYKKLFVTHST